jgi:hypothetical protein
MPFYLVKFPYCRDPLWHGQPNLGAEVQFSPASDTVRSILLCSNLPLGQIQISQEAP